MSHGQGLNLSGKGTFTIDYPSLAHPLFNQAFDDHFLHDQEAGRIYGSEFESRLPYTINKRANTPRHTQQLIDSGNFPSRLPGKFFVSLLSTSLQSLYKSSIVTQNDNIEPQDDTEMALDLTQKSIGPLEDKCSQELLNIKQMERTSMDFVDANLPDRPCLGSHRSFPNGMTSDRSVPNQTYLTPHHNVHDTHHPPLENPSNGACNIEDSPIVGPWFNYHSNEIRYPTSELSPSHYFCSPSNENEEIFEHSSTLDIPPSYRNHSVDSLIARFVPPIRIQSDLNALQKHQTYTVGDLFKNSLKKSVLPDTDHRACPSITLLDHRLSPPLNFNAFRLDQNMICPMCQKSFRFEKNLLRHLQKTHATGTGESVLKCKLCNYTTRHYSNMYVHIRTHTGDKPYSCAACGVSFTQGSSLKLHIKSRHQDNNKYFSLARKPGKNNLTKLWTRVLKKDLPKYNSCVYSRHKLINQTTFQRSWLASRSTPFAYWPCSALYQHTSRARNISMVGYGADAKGSFEPSNKWSELVTSQGLSKDGILPVNQDVTFLLRMSEFIRKYLSARSTPLDADKRRVELSELGEITCESSLGCYHMDKSRHPSDFGIGDQQTWPNSPIDPKSGPCCMGLGQMCSIREATESSMEIDIVNKLAFKESPDTAHKTIWESFDLESVKCDQADDHSSHLNGFIPCAEST